MMVKVGLVSGGAPWGAPPQATGSGASPLKERGIKRGKIIPFSCGGERGYNMMQYTGSYLV